MHCRTCGTEPEELSGAMTPAEQKRARPYRARIAAAAASILLAAAAATGCAANTTSTATTDQSQDAQSTDVAPAPLEPQQVAVAITAPGYTSDATRIPLHVTGADSSGAAVDTTEYVGADDASFKVNPGTYQVTVVASPILEDGTLFQVPDTPIDLAVPDPNATGSSSDGSKDATDAPSIAIALDPIADPLKVTDEQIEAAQNAAASDPDDNGKAAQFAQAATGKKEAIQKRCELAVEYIQALQTTEDPLPDDENAVKMIDTDMWMERIGAYVEPCTDDTVSAIYMAHAEAATIIRDPQVISIDGDEYTVSYQKAGTQGIDPGWSQRFDEHEDRLTFDSANKIVGDVFIYEGSESVVF